ncbi:hypothetical protein G6F50_015103 [Rhizopus delemar]|uniref:Uncharacterized protein n=1 Tax=Rhizopus delemar TaxID=936053 RepID=A0A9P7C5I2_9FUNG|nr:hypothetical protein G6F50_015103 [Rhizopus delemar]
MARLTSWLFRLAPLLLLPLAAGALAEQASPQQARDAALVNRVTWGATPTELARAIAARGAATHRCLVHFAAIGRAGTGSPDRHTAKGQRPFRRGQAEREPPSQTNGA